MGGGETLPLILLTKECKMKNHTINRFFGGQDRGVCLQITSNKPLVTHNTAIEQIQEEGFIQLDRDDAILLQKELVEFIGK